MTAHNHTEVVPGCFRCELSSDEASKHEELTLVEKAAKTIHDGENAQKQYDSVGIARHSWDDCPYKPQYLADAMELHEAGLLKEDDD